MLWPSTVCCASVIFSGGSSYIDGCVGVVGCVGWGGFRVVSMRFRSMKMGFSFSWFMCCRVLLMISVGSSGVVVRYWKASLFSW